VTGDAHEHRNAAKKAERTFERAKPLKDAAARSAALTFFPLLTKMKVEVISSSQAAVRMLAGLQTLPPSCYWRVKAMPATAQYMMALKALNTKLAPKWRELLRSHWAAPKHTTSAALLARAVGYPNHSAVNLNYGLLAAKIASLVGIPKRDFNLRAIATWRDTRPNS
jgi:hypothetical protein